MSKEIKLLHVFLPQPSSARDSHHSCENQYRHLKPFLAVLQNYRRGRIKKRLLHVRFLPEALFPRRTGCDLARNSYTHRQPKKKKHPHKLSFVFPSSCCGQLLETRASHAMQTRKHILAFKLQFFCSNNMAAINSFSSSPEQPRIALTYARHPLFIPAP